MSKECAIHKAEKGFKTRCGRVIQWGWGYTYRELDVTCKLCLAKGGK